MASKPTYEELEKRVRELEQAEAQKKRAEERTEHLNRVLRAISNVNQLIIRERDRDRLLQGICQNFVETRGYSNAWIALWDEKGGLEATAEAEVGDDWPLMEERLKKGELTSCSKRALGQEGLVVIEDPPSECIDCPLAANYIGRRGMTARLEYGGKFYGLLSVSIPAKLTIDEEEQALLKEVADDIAYALHDLELEEQSRRDKEELIQKSEEQALLLDTIEAQVWYLTDTETYGTANRAHLESLGLRREDVENKKLIEFLSEEVARVCEETNREVFDKKTTVKSEEWVPNAKGEEQLLSITKTPKLDEEGNVRYVVCVGIDTTKRKHAEEALRESEERYRILSEESPLGIAFIDKNGSYQYVNPKFTEIFGYTLEEIPNGREWFRKAFPEKEKRQEVISAWTNDMRDYGVGESGPRTYTVTCKNGEEKIIHFKPVTMKSGDHLVLYDDVTEKHRLEAQFQQAQRMESIGTLAGGIAHDFNNLLMSIQGNASLLLLEKESSSPDYESLKNIEQCVHEGAGLTKQLLGFARGGKYEISPTDLNELLKSHNRVFGRTKKEINIHAEYAEGVWPVEVDRSQIQQALMNLYVNAAQAMPGGGDLYVETENVILEENYVRPFEIHPGRYVKISVTDTGTGMDEKTKGRIFEPFFTTREMGRGTGLGLASVYGIIKNHGGVINVYSEKGQGSTFTIYLPASEKETQEETEISGKIVKGEGTILLVDDEERVLHVGERLLERLGYRVLAAQNGEEAVEIYEKNRDDIDLVLLDMIMPGMGGGETYDRLKQINPDIKVLLSSGYSINGQAREILDRGCNGFIQKPFNMEGLSQKIRELLF